MDMKNEIIKIKSGVLVLLMLGFASIVKAQDGYQVGDIATDFTLKNVNNRMIVMADYTAAKGFLVVFTCNHCPYSKLYEQRIMDLDQKYAAKGFPVLAINPNDEKAYPEDSFENMKKRSAEKKYSFPYLLDDTQVVAKTYGAKATPHVYVLQKTNKGLVVQYIGAIDNDTENINAPTSTKYVENAVDALLNNKKVETTQTKAIGCAIKWKTTE
jgi:peroxiredoxin